MIENICSVEVDSLVKRARYSWLKNLILAILASGEVMHGYVIYKRIEEAVGARWRPSIGTFYRILMRLRNEGMIECYKQNRRTVCKISDKGLNYMIDEISLHLPKFLGVINEVLKAYVYVVKNRNTNMDLDTVNKLKKLMNTVVDSLAPDSFRYLCASES